MDLSDVQPEKISLPREARRSPPSSVTLPSAEQPANALLPMETSPAGRSNCVSDEQPAKALSPIAEQVAPSANVYADSEKGEVITKTTDLFGSDEKTEAKGKSVFGGTINDYLIKNEISDII